MNEDLLMDRINEALYPALEAALREGAWPPRPAVLIRRAYVNPPPPPPPPDRDIVYYHAVPENVPPLTEESPEEGGRAVFRYARWQLNTVFYGPHALSRAWDLYHCLYLDGYEQPRRILRQRGIYPAPRPQSPRMVWEEWGEAHRPRADFSACLQIAENLLLPSPGAQSIVTAPEILIHSSKEAI